MLKKGIEYVAVFCLMLMLASCSRIEKTKIDELEETVPEFQDSQTTDFDIKAMDLTQEELVNHDMILYFVNCATENVTNVVLGDHMGLYQSVTDQKFGADAVTGIKWGYVEQPYYSAEGDVSSADKNAAKWVIAENTKINPEETGFYYDFSVPEGEYEVTCGFSDPFSARPISVKAEDEIMIKDQKILKYQSTEAVFKKQITDGMLNLLVYNPKSGDEVMKDPVLSYIIIRKVPEYNNQLLTCLIDSEMLSEAMLEEYTAKSIEKYQAALAEAKELLNQINAAEDDYKKAYTKLKEEYRNMEKKPVYNSFRPGEVWNDTENVLIQAHGGQVQRLPVKDKETGAIIEKWWWVGEDKTNGSHGGICAYSSDDLYNWTYEGIVMRNVSSRQQLEDEQYFKDLYGAYTKEQLDNVYICINDSTSIIERPKMLYCEKTGQYVIWFHADGPTATSDSSYAAASAGVAVSATPYGPFKFIDRYRLNTCPSDQEDKFPQSKGMARDMNLFVDDDGTAYIIYSSEENLTLYISKLNDTYTYLVADPKEAVYGKDYIRIFPGAQREAPAVFKRNGKYYMMTSGCTGWRPNQAKMFMADSMLGVWEDMGNPCIGDTQNTTFDSQSTCIFLAEKETQTYVYMGDRWNSEDLADSRYLWLPVEFDADGKASISFTKEWQLP